MRGRNRDRSFGIFSRKEEVTKGKDFAKSKHWQRFSPAMWREVCLLLYHSARRPFTIRDANTNAKQ
jgi:hypothetical protein